MGVVLVGMQWGDEGKGKITDYLAARADMVVRYQGGSNAGHTVVIDGQTHKFHLIPSGMLAGRPSVIGNGVVVDPRLLLDEMGLLAENEVDLGNLYVSHAAHVVMPYHKRLDQLQERRRGSESLGTTKQGIGPAYTDKFDRSGIRIGDLLYPEVLAAKLERNLEHINVLMRDVYESEAFSREDLAEEYAGYGESLKDHVCDAASLVNEALGDDRQVLFEGAQGTMLDVDHGTYPYVTSSNPTAGGACTGSGVGPTQISRVLGVVKAYTSRVGAGPFPTELSGELGDIIRRRGEEYGTTTGRPRRCGWLDAVVLRRSVELNGLTGICLTNLDVLGGLDSVNISVAYRIGEEITERIPFPGEALARCEPIYIQLPGWEGDISSARSWDQLPPEARTYVRTLEGLLGIPVKIISVGPARGATIIKEEIFS